MIIARIGASFIFPNFFLIPGTTAAATGRIRGPWEKLNFDLRRRGFWRHSRPGFHDFTYSLTLVYTRHQKFISLVQKVPHIFPYLIFDNNFEIDCFFICRQRQLRLCKKSTNYIFFYDSFNRERKDDL